METAEQSAQRRAREEAARVVCEHENVAACGFCMAKDAPRCKLHGRPWYCGECGNAEGGMSDYPRQLIETPEGVRWIPVAELTEAERRSGRRVAPTPHLLHGTRDGRAVTEAYEDLAGALVGAAAWEARETTIPVRITHGEVEVVGEAKLRKWLEGEGE